MVFLCPLYMDSPSRIFRHLAGREEEKNPITKLYNRLFRADIGRWLCACAVIGLSAGAISERPGSKTLAAAAYNLAVASLHFFIPKVPVHPQGPMNSKPPTWYIVFLAVSMAMWTAAFTTIFVIRGSGFTEDVYKLGQHNVRTGFTNAETNLLGVMQSLTIACGCCGIIALMFCFYQCYVVHQLFTTGFKKSEMREALRKGTNKPSKEDNADAKKIGLQVV